MMKETNNLPKRRVKHTSNAEEQPFVHKMLKLTIIHQLKLKWLLIKF
jgi:hypothetical protein